MEKKNRLMIFGFLALALVPNFITPSFAQTGIFGLDHIGADGLSTLVSIDKTTGVATAIGATGFERCSGMDFNPGDGIMYATCERTGGSDVLVLVTLNLSTGAATEVGEVMQTGQFGNTIADLSFRNSDNTLYAYIEPIDGLGTIAIGTGAITELGSTGVACCGNGMAFNTGDVLHHANSDSTGVPTLVTLGTLDQTLATQTDGPDLIFSAPMDNALKINAMDWDDSTSTMYASCNDRTSGGARENYLCTVALGSGVVTVIGATIDGLDAIAFGPVGFGDFVCWLEIGTQDALDAFIGIRDQFGPVTNTGDFYTQAQYCTATEKNGEPSPFSPELNQHYQDWFYIGTPVSAGPGTTVIIEVPQFDNFEIELGTLEQIMVPATKHMESGPVASVDFEQHWNCYNLVDGPTPDSPQINLRTQHGDILNVNVGAAFIFCTPMVKEAEAGGGSFGQLLDDHMVCYRISAEENLTLPLGLSDQLSDFDGLTPFVPLDNLVLEKLCVPAFKSFPSVGGSMIPIDTTALLLAGVQSISMWMIPVVIACVGVSIFVVIRKNNHS